ncbi:MAG: tRNA (adenosine(37)-N6)-threonylcarbamoyltransferase complex ATPase subunit type 1 TsaE [Vulcanimicrobiaceae bacterium]
MKPATTEHTAPEIMPTTMSLKRHTSGAFPARLVLSSPDAMRAAAGELAAHLTPGDVVAVEGPLGSGKTTFVQGLVAAVSGTAVATSPTFTFWHRYPGVEHLDLYRIEDSRELAELGLEEAFGPDAITVVEWPEKAPELVGTPDWRVTIAGSGDGPRAVAIAPRE